MIRSSIPYHLKWVCFVLALVLLSTSAWAQDEMPREYTNPDEIVAFDKSTNYTEAIEVINQFLQEYRNKFIIDQSGASGVIGVNLPPMHWEDALKYILRVKNLGSRDNEDFIEILPLSELEAQQRSGNSLAVLPDEGLPENADLANVDLDTREIRINATFFEGNRRALQEIGVDWSTLTNGAPEVLNQIVAGQQGLGVGQQGLPQTGVDFSDQFVSVNSFNARTVSQNVFNALVNFGEIGPGISVQALFSAFEADNLGEVLATPSIKVMDGQEGTMQVGQDFSIKQRDIAGNVTDAFFSVGTILTVTPTVIVADDTTFIHLNLSVERSTAQPDVVSTIIQKQEAQTQALLLDGEATSIAGLYRTEQSQVRRGIPILKDLPPWLFGLRYLFGYNSTDNIENELIILVQAELEQSLRTRIKKGFKTKREVLSEGRERSKNDLDLVFENIYAEAIAEVPESVPVIEPPVSEVEDKPDTLIVDDTDDMPEEIAPVEDPQPEMVEEELTEEEIRLAEELSLPVENPELMTVVPRAFSLDEYLERRTNGEEVEDATANGLKYFVIGGSFLIKRNATRFNQMLMESGYETRVLFHPESRFNYVAYQGFKTFDEALKYLFEIRQELNDEAWLFTKK